MDQIYKTDLNELFSYQRKGEKLEEKEKVIEIEIERLRDFKEHPFHVKDDKEMSLLKESIKNYGILSPLIVRPVLDGVYEIVSGHRRKYAAQQLGYYKLPVIIRVMNDDEAIISMVDSNLQRERIHPFAGHPFKVIDDDKMQDLVESVRENGVITPVLIRPAMENQYEMISGHRRMHAAKLAGLSNIPAIVREMTDDEAVIAMVDANIQREELLPSEKAFAYKMKLSAMKRQAGRPGKNNSSQNGTNLRSDQVLAEEVGISRNQIQRYIRLTELIPELLNLVDDKKLQFTVAVEISYIDKEIQKWIYEYIRDNGFIKPIQITALRKQLETEKVSQNFMISIFNNAITPKKTNRKITLTEKKLTRYFPPEYSQEEMEKVIETLLEEWTKRQEG